MTIANGLLIRILKDLFCNTITIDNNNGKDDYFVEVISALYMTALLRKEKLLLKAL